MKLELYYPLKPLRITQIFGVNGDYYRANGFDVLGHNGIDMGAYHGQPVYAAHDGLCYPNKLNPNEGAGVVLVSTEKYEYKGSEYFFKTIYWHLLYSIPIQAGELVKKGQIIGFADNTGFSHGDHLHFGLKPILGNEDPYAWGNLEQNNGYYGAIDPLPYFVGKYAVDTRTFFERLSEISHLLTWLQAIVTKGR